MYVLGINLICTNITMNVQPGFGKPDEKLHFVSTRLWVLRNLFSTDILSLRDDAGKPDNCELKHSSIETQTFQFRILHR
jgi:hypothetical protein